VLSVDPHERADLDYEAYPDQPEAKNCGYQDLIPLQPYRNMLEAQQKAETGERAWSFDDPQRVATDGLAGLLKIAPQSITAIKKSKNTAGRVVYTWRPRGKQVRYMVVISRPYWLSFYAHQGGKVAWVLAAAYEECGN